MTGLILPFAPKSEERFPAIIRTLVLKAGLPPEHMEATTAQYTAFVRGFAKDMLDAAFMPVTEITLEEMRYEHNDIAVARDKAMFPNGYPIVGIYFNGILVGVTGILFDGKAVSAKQAETKTAMLLLKKEVKAHGTQTSR